MYFVIVYNISAW